MTDFLSDLVSIATLVFAVSSMLAVGFRYTIHEIIEPLRNIRLLIGAVVANFILVPLLAYAITKFMSFGEDREIGLLLVSCAAGAPFLIKLVQLAGGEVAIATGLLVLLLVVTVPYMPIVVPRIASEADVSAASIAQPLIFSMLLPLAIGLIADRFVPEWTSRLIPILGPLSTIALVALVASTVLSNFNDILDVFGTGAILAALLFIVGSFAIGYVLGITGSGTREELALGTAQRNIAAATVVATQSLNNADTTVMVVVTSMVSMAVLFPTASVLRKLATPDTNSAQKASGESQGSRPTPSGPRTQSRG
jgi:BASS family bile acid:Na+ symporter